MGLFGRRKEPPQPPTPPAKGPGGDDNPGHAAVLAHLRELDKTQPAARAQLAGSIIFDLVCKIIGDTRGVRIEDALAILGSVGGHACLLAGLDAAAREGAKAGSGALAIASGADGNRYYFGDLPNRFLLESQMSLLSLTLGAAQFHGGAVSLEKVHDVMRHVASSVGTGQFGVPRITGEHRPGDTPFNYIKYLAPKIMEALDLYEVPADARPAAMGFAIQRAIDAGKQIIDPVLAADIVTECAVPAAKFAPERFR